MAIKELKSIDISSFTIISTGIAVLFSIIISILLTISIGLLVPNSFATIAYLIPTIVFGTIISCIFTFFSVSYLYNVLSKRFSPIKLDIEENIIKKVSPKETGLIAGCIVLIMVLVVYFAFSLLIPLFLSSLITVMMYGSQINMATLAYQLLFLTSDPTFIAVGIIGSVIIISVFILLATYIYNILANSERGIIVELTKEDKLTQLESLTPVNFGIAIGAISLILNIIVGLILVISGVPIFNTLVSILLSFVIAFIEAVLIAIFYNLLSPRIGKLKVELE
ncbi:hypothetical protein [Methanobrevibacter sp.]|uniref:hypothetical protein n=1 Tax=Methanobrevibacter sp. TaxID=66852 RepID=UPI003890AD15